MKSAVVVLLSFILCQCSATIDLSNVDLLNFKYFKHFPSSDSGHSNDDSPFSAVLEPITEHFQKKKAVLVYFKNVLFGNPLHEEARVIEFDPHFGEAWKPHYEHHYGPKGAHLIDILGKGYSPNSLKHYKAVSHSHSHHY